MPYCRYCLNEHPAEEMPSPRTCKRCRDEQFHLGKAKAKIRNRARRTRIKNAVAYYFQRERIKHKPFPGDENKIQDILRQMIKANRYKRRLLSVDHIVPVSHPLVSGLTVSWNLQILLHVENMAKGNYCNLDLESIHLYNWCKERGL